MPSERAIVETLNRKELLELVTHFDLKVGDRRIRDNLIDALASARETRLDKILGQLSLTSLKEVCRKHGLDDSGRLKSQLIERILDVPVPAKKTAAKPAKKGEVRQLRQVKEAPREVKAKAQPPKSAKSASKASKAIALAKAAKQAKATKPVKATKAVKATKQAKAKPVKATKQAKAPKAVKPTKATKPVKGKSKVAAKKPAAKAPPSNVIALRRTATKVAPAKKPGRVAKVAKDVSVPAVKAAPVRAMKPVKAVVAAPVPEPKAVRPKIVKAAAAKPAPKAVPPVVIKAVPPIITKAVPPTITKAVPPTITRAVPPTITRAAPAMALVEKAPTPVAAIAGPDSAAAPAAARPTPLPRPSTPMELLRDTTLGAPEPVSAVMRQCPACSAEVQLRKCQVQKCRNMLVVHPTRKICAECLFERNTLSMIDFNQRLEEEVRCPQCDGASLGR